MCFIFALAFIGIVYVNSEIYKTDQETYALIDYHKSLLPGNEQKNVTYDDLYFESDEFEASSNQITVKELLILVISLLTILPAYILSLVIIYKGWKAITPLTQFFPNEARGYKGISYPGWAVGQLFIPGFNVYWFFGVFFKMEKYGRIISQLTNSRYIGSTKILATSAVLVCYLSNVFSKAYEKAYFKAIDGKFAYETVNNLLVISGILEVATAILFIMLFRNINCMVSHITVQKPLAVNPVTLGGIDISELGTAGEAN